MKRKKLTKVLEKLFCGAHGRRKIRIPAFIWTRLMNIAITKWLLSPIMLLALVICFFACREKDVDESRLKERISQHYQNLIKGQYEKAWEMLYDENKAPESWPKEQWIDFWKEAFAKERWISARIEKIEIKRQKDVYVAFVSLKISRQGYSKLEKKDINLDDAWAYIRGDWYRVLND